MEIMFNHFPVLEEAYELMQELRSIFNMKIGRLKAGVLLAKWYEKVKATGRATFKTVVRTFKNYSTQILNYFKNRSTNAAAESFNAKVKLFRAQLRGVQDPAFFIFRLCKLFA